MGVPQGNLFMCQKHAGSHISIVTARFLFFFFLKHLLRLPLRKQHHLPPSPYVVHPRSNKSPPFHPLDRLCKCRCKSSASKSHEVVNGNIYQRVLRLFVKKCRGCRSLEARRLMMNMRIFYDSQHKEACLGNKTSP